MSNYAFYALSNMSKILACLVPDDSCHHSCIASGEAVVEAAKAVDWGLLSEACPDGLPNSEKMCEVFTPNGLHSSSGVLHYSPELDSTNIGEFETALCRAGSRELLSNLQIIGIVCGSIAACVALCCLTAMAINFCSQSSKLGHRASNFCRGFFKSSQGGGEQPRAPLVVVDNAEISNPVYGT